MALAVYAIALFLGAALIVAVQPLIGKMFLPHLSSEWWPLLASSLGSIRLAGFLYAHCSASFFNYRIQILVHSLLCLAPVGFIWTLDPTPPARGQELMPFVVQELLPTFLLPVFLLPSFVLLSSIPLLPSWFTRAGGVAGRDPYFLYCFTSFGSMLSFVGYSLFIEPTYTIAEQRFGWGVGYGLICVLTLGCGALAWRNRRDLSLSEESLLPAPPTDTAIKTMKEASLNGVHEPAISAKPPALPRLAGMKLRLAWVGLAAVPACLAHVVASYLTMDIAPVPLLWILPSGLLQLSFVLVFMKWPVEWIRWPPRSMVVVGLCLIPLAFVSQWSPGTDEKTLRIICLSLSGLFIVAMACHGTLARLRPPARNLTEFYLWMIGGEIVGYELYALLFPLLFGGERGM